MRTLDKKGQPLLLPEHVLDSWTTTLGPEAGQEQMIASVPRTVPRPRHEPFHAEFKTDMDLNRQPSGKLVTNHLVCALAAVAMNLLCKAALRRPIKTVMQEMMFKAARIISHASGWVLGISGSDSGFALFERAHGKFKAA